MPAAEPKTTSLQEVSSTVYPKLERVPGKQNWVDKAGGLPNYIERIAKHLHYEKGKDIGTAIAIAVNTVKKWSTGVNHNGSKLKAATVAKAQKAVAEWMQKRGKSKLQEALSEDDSLSLSPEEAASLVGDFRHRLALAEGMAMGLKGQGTRNRASRVASALALLEGREAKMHLGRGNADPRELSRAQSMLGQEIAELKVILEALGAPAFPPPQVAGPPAPRRQGKQKAKGRGGAPLPFDESKHPRAAKGRTGGGQFIRSGSSGPEVKGVQRAVGAKVDGRFGRETKKKVEDFQREKGLTVDGVVGSQTAGALGGTKAIPGPLLSHHRSSLRKAKARFSSSHIAAEDAAEKRRNKANKARKEAKKEAESKSKSSSGTSSSKSSSSSSSSSSSQGGAGSVFGEGSSLPTKVAQLIQRKLGIATSGTYDEKTKERVEEFQENHGLQVDGIVGTQTLAALRGDQSPPAPGAFTESDWTWLSSNQAGGQREAHHKQQQKKQTERQREEEKTRLDRERKREEQAQVKPKAKVQEALIGGMPIGGGGLTGGTEFKWNPSLHPRNREGEFIDVLNSLAHKMSFGNLAGKLRKVNLTEGVSVEKTGRDKFELKTRNGTRTISGTAAAARAALDAHAGEVSKRTGISVEKLREAAEKLSEAIAKDDFHRRHGAGMSGQPDEATGHLQGRLSELGYDTGSTDGRFGDKTKAAVEEFQGDHGLAVDGEVGSSTKIALRGTDPEEVSRARQKAGAAEDDSEGTEVDAAKDKSSGKSDSPAEESAEGKATAEGEDDGDEEEAPSLADSVLTKGTGVADEDPDGAVAHMQKTIGAEADGRFGPETERKLKSVQRRYGLKADGVVGPKTGRLLDRMASKTKPKKGSEGEAKLNEAILDRMEAAASGDTEAFTRARARERHLRESSLRGFLGGLTRDFYRLDDGTFAPKGRGKILKPGEKINLPHRSGAGKVSAKIEHVSGGRALARITDGPDKGKLASIRSAAPQASRSRPFPEPVKRLADLPPGDPSNPTQVAEVKGQNYLDRIDHAIAKGEDSAVQDHLDDMASDHAWAAGRGYGAAMGNYDLAKERGDHFLASGEAPPESSSTPETQRAPIDFHGASDGELEDLISNSLDSNGLPKSGRDRSIFLTAMKERKRRAKRAFDAARSDAAKEAASNVYAQVTGQRLSGQPAVQFAPPEGFTPNAGEKQLKEMQQGDTFYVGKHDQAYTWHKPTLGGDFIIAKPLDGGKAKVFHREFAPPFIGHQGEAAPEPGSAVPDDTLYDQLKKSLHPKTGPFGEGAPSPPLSETLPDAKKSPARSSKGNLRNFKAMSDEKLTGLAEEMKDHPEDAEAIAAITNELQSRAGAKGQAAGPGKSKLAAGEPKASKGKSSEEKIASAWAAYDKKKADFDALPDDADKGTKAKAAAQVRAAKFRIKRVGGDPNKPPKKKTDSSTPAAPAAPPAAPKKAAPEPPKDETVVYGPGGGGSDLDPEIHATVNLALAGEELGGDWDATTVGAALDKLETNGIVFDRENEKPEVIASVIKAAGLAPSELKTQGTV